MTLNKKIIFIVFLTLLIIISIVLIVNFSNRQALQKISLKDSTIKNSNIIPTKITRNNNCQIPKRNNTNCSELSYQECQKNNLCFAQEGKRCLAPPQNYINTLSIIKENCQISGGEWGNILMYLNKFGGCICPKSSKTIYPDDGFCENSIIDVAEKKKLPEDFYRYYDVLRGRQEDFYTNPSDDKIINDTVINDLIVYLHSDYNNMDEAEYVACLYDGKVVGRIFLLSAYQIEFNNNTIEETKILAKKIENEPTVNFVSLNKILHHGTVAN